MSAANGEVLDLSSLTALPLDAALVRLLELVNSGAVLELEMPLVHTFTPGLYSRQITMPAGAGVISEVHKTEHQFVISKGVVTVYIEGKGMETLRAPHSGVTLPGTQRLLLVHEETVWTTFHCTVPEDGSDPEKVKARIIEPTVIPDNL